MERAEEQQYCLRWNNFQANFTSQFETLRDDEDFTDVTIACDGQKLQAHRVVLSACSPYFKEIFKANPCSHPIIFMRDVEARHVVALLEFMYAGEVNVAQAHLSAFLKTAESLKIRGLTDSPSESNNDKDTLTLNPKSKQQPKTTSIPTSNTQKRSNSNTTTVNNTATVQTTAACSSTVTSSQDDNKTTLTELLSQKAITAIKAESTDVTRITRRSNTNEDNVVLEEEDEEEEEDDEEDCIIDENGEGDLVMDEDMMENGGDGKIEPKLELGDYLSDDEGQGYYAEGAGLGVVGALLDEVNFPGGMEILPQSSNSQGFTNNHTPIHQSSATKQLTHTHEPPYPNSNQSLNNRLHSLDPRPCDVCGRVYSNLSNLRQHMKLIHYPTHVSCTLCSRPFKTDLYLRRHMSTAHAQSGGAVSGGAGVDIEAIIAQQQRSARYRVVGGLARSVKYNLRS